MFYQIPTKLRSAEIIVHLEETIDRSIEPLSEIRSLNVPIAMNPLQDRGIVPIIRNRGLIGVQHHLLPASVDATQTFSHRFVHAEAPFPHVEVQVSRMDQEFCDATT